MQSRLSQIATRWSLLRDAHAVEPSRKQRAHAELFERYRGAAYRYLVAILRSPDAADDVFQEFAVRLIQGRFEGAAPERGCFRQYLKTSLTRLAIDYQRRRVGAALSLPEDVAAETDSEAARFDECWRTELLDRAWTALEESDRQTGRVSYAVLRFRSQNPQASSREIADALTSHLQPERPLTDAGVRQMLHRAREQFAELLVAEVAASLGCEEPDEIETELAALQLTSYCRSAIDAQRKRTE
jgi:RNA polymerase sigma-70 factor (ECF subfamily)